MALTTVSHYKQLRADWKDIDALCQPSTGLNFLKGLPIMTIQDDTTVEMG